MTQILQKPISKAILVLGLLALPVTALAQNCIKLLVPLPCGTSCLQPGALPLDIIRTYFDCMYPFVVGTAAGITVLWTIIAGGALILYAGDDSKREAQKENFKNSLIGLFVVLFAGTIMNFINPLGFQ